MTTKVTMPQMGESIFEGTLTKWLKKQGEQVVRDEPLFEISTDKVDSEIPSPASGILSQILVPEGRTVQINTVLAIINGAGAEEKGAALAHSGDIAAQELPDERPPASEERPLPPPPEPVRTEASKPAEAAPAIRVQDVRTSPLVRRLARENNIDLTQVPATGLEGRITKEDIVNYLARRGAPGQSAAAEEDATLETPLQSERAPSRPSLTASPEEAPRFAGESESVPMTAMRKGIAEHMVLSKRTSAHVSTVFEVEMSGIVGLRERYRNEFEKREGVPLTFTPFFAKALVDNVREFPIFNSSVSGDAIIYKKAVNLGIAVALESGLIVPVVKDAQLRSLTGIALAIHDLAERARGKRLRPEDVQNGTISITNPGAFGGLFGTPIISQPQVAILSIGGIGKRPVVVNDAIAIRSMVYLSLSFDHRVIDGAVADRFMARLKERLQSWTSWMD